MPVRVRSIALTAGLAALAACSGTPKPRATPPPPRPQATAATEIDAILALLDQGKTGDARKRIAAGLKRSPADPSLQVLRDSIERDPQELLGPTSHAYTVQPGDTMTALANRFLGNRLKFYQLARYNKIARPAGLAAGTVIRVPGEEARAEPVRPRPRPVVETPKPTPRAPIAARPAAPVTPPPPAADPAAARQARAAGLAALNAGQVNRAVAQLRRAAQLDPGNPAIARDLARAQRIAATVRARR